MPVYDEKYTKVKLREFNGVIKTNFITGLFRRMQIQNKENKDV